MFTHLCEYSIFSTRYHWFDWRSCLSILFRCGNVAAILELDEHLQRDFTIFEAAPQVRHQSLKQFLLFSEVQKTLCRTSQKSSLTSLSRVYSYKPSFTVSRCNHASLLIWLIVDTILALAFFRDYEGRIFRTLLDDKFHTRFCGLDIKSRS